MNLGVRDYFTYTNAMLNNSLFSQFLKKNGLDIHVPKKKPSKPTTSTIKDDEQSATNKESSSDNKKESTRDLICLDFDFGSRSYKDEKKRLEDLKNESDDEEFNDKISKRIERVDKKHKRYNEKTREDIRTQFYQRGVSIEYKTKDKNEKIKSSVKIHYKMLFRTSAKAKLGQVIFINEKLYDKAYDWITMGLGNKMPKNNAKIVELSAYAPLTTSTIVGTMNIPVEDILILEDQDSFYRTAAKIVKAEEYYDDSGRLKKKCIVSDEETSIKNTLWDGMGLIESSILPEWVNGMALLRNHFFKMDGFRSNIQLFFQDWCNDHGYDYDTYQVQDMFGRWHKLKDIKVITTDNAIKWKKFVNIMGGTLELAYDYWCEKIRADNDTWGIVKTDHESKLGDYQQLSYQMINTLPCNREDVENIAMSSKLYIELLKTDNDVFEEFLRKFANEINHYEMLADLYKHNHNIAQSDWFRNEKKKIIHEHVYKLRKGKIWVEGDNLTACGNPYALLLYSVGDNFECDPTFSQESDTIQCFTTRFTDGEYLAAFRNPHNSPNNICYLHNVYSDEMWRYFAFSPNIIAINCIRTDIQCRANGMDFDSDFLLVTNQPDMVRNAKQSYKDFPTIVNALQESGVTYKNTLAEYARMDNKFSKSRIGIGYSSNLAQLAMTYYWTELRQEVPNKEKTRELYDNFIILSVLAQVIIDGCKREYEIDGMEEIGRISRLPCMDITKDDPDNGITFKCDFPEFMRYTREIKCTKNGKELPIDDITASRNKLKNRINSDLICPMNWLEDYLDKIRISSRSSAIPIINFFIKKEGAASNKNLAAMRKAVEEFDKGIRKKIAEGFKSEEDKEEFIQSTIEKSAEIVDNLSKITIVNNTTINRLIETSLGIDKVNNNKNCYKSGTKYARKMLNLLYKMNPTKFLSNFTCE